MTNNMYIKDLDFCDALVSASKFMWCHNPEEIIDTVLMPASDLHICIHTNT